MANTRRAQAAPQPPKGDKPTPQTKPGLYVILRVDELPSEGGDAPVRIGERLTVIKVAEGTSSDTVARAHRKAQEEDWRKVRAAGKSEDYPQGLPEQFPPHRYRCISLGAYTPGHEVQEVRDTKAATF